MVDIAQVEREPVHAFGKTERRWPAHDWLELAATQCGFGIGLAGVRVRIDPEVEIFARCAKIHWPACKASGVESAADAACAMTIAQANRIRVKT